MRGGHFRGRRRLCCPQIASPLWRERAPQESALPDGAIWKSSHYWPREENQSFFKILRTFSNSLGLAPRAKPSRAFQKSLGAKLHVCCASGRTSLNIGLRVVPHEPRLKLVCGHRPLILLGRVGVPHDSPTTRPHRRLQLSFKACRCCRVKAHWRPTRLDTRLRSARARGTLTSGGQAEKRQCFSRQSPARETKGNAPDGAKRGREEDGRCASATFFTWQTCSKTLPPPAIARFAEPQAEERRECEARSGQNLQSLLPAAAAG